MTDNEKKYRIKKAAAQIMVDIYDQMINREQETDEAKRADITDEVLKMQQKRNNLLKRVKV